MVDKVFFSSFDMHFLCSRDHDINVSGNPRDKQKPGEGTALGILATCVTKVGKACTKP